MTLASQLPYEYLSGNGVSVDFVFLFRAFQDPDTGATGILVYLEDNDPSSETYGDLTLKSEGVDYSVELDSDLDYPAQTLGGTVTFSTAPTSLQNVLCLSNTELTQTKKYSGGGTFPAASHEGGLDKLTRVNQEQQLALNMSLRVPIFEADTFNSVLPKASIRAGKAFTFDNNGDIIMTDAVTQEVIEDIMQAKDDAEAAVAAAEAGQAGAEGAQADSEAAQAAAEAARDEAAAYAASIDMPDKTGNALKFLRVNATENGMEWEEVKVPSGILVYSMQNLGGA